MTSQLKKKQRKEMIRNYKPTADQIAREVSNWDNLVSGRAEYYDILTTEEALVEPEKKQRPLINAISN